MAYKQGDLHLVDGGPCDQIQADGFCTHEPEHESIMDARGDADLTRGVYLPHSCDSWVIGGPKQIRLLIADLQAALELLEG